MVVIAVGEVIMFSARPSRTAWILILSQALCVALFQYSSSFPAPPLLPPPLAEAASGKDGLQDLPGLANAAAEASAVDSPPLPEPVQGAALGVSAWAGMCACLASVATGGFGNILQQRFMQKQSKAIPVSVKLFYQHIIELFLVLVLLQLRSEARNHLWTYGFFGGWNQWTTVVSVTMWFSFLSASAISAYISAIAGAFAVAVSVALTGVLEFVFFGRIFSPEQFTLMTMVCMIAMLYTRERMSALTTDAAEPLDGGRIMMTQREHLKADNDETAQECQSLCEFGFDDVPLYHTDTSGTPTQWAGAAHRQCATQSDGLEL